MVFEDEDLLVVDKPAGLLTSTVARERRPTALAIVQAFYAKEARVSVGLVHRLDRDASGLLVFAKSPRAMRSLKAQFFDHSAGREYEALVHGSPEPTNGTIDVPLVESKEGKVFAARSSAHAQPAITHYQTVRVEAGRALLHLQLETGRKHQLRAPPGAHQPSDCRRYRVRPAAAARVDTAIAGGAAEDRSPGGWSADDV